MIKDIEKNDNSKLKSRNKISRMALIYLIPENESYYVTDDSGYTIMRRPLLGLQYLSAVLEKKGIKTALLDQSVSGFDLNWLIGELKNYNIIGFYCSDPQETKVKDYCQKIKEKSSIPILVGGPSTLSNNSFLDFGCDIVVHGEGEKTIQDIMLYYNGEKDIEQIRGISFKKNKKIIEAPPQELIENLDSLPFPDRSKVDINAYYDYFLFDLKMPYITMIASRGCLYRCAYCTSCKIWGQRYRRRSVDNVIAEIDDAVKKYNIKYIAFQDDIFGGTNEWIENFCKKLIAKPYKIRWMAILHPFTLKNDIYGTLKLMKEAGCTTLSFGLQTAHPKILKNINRHSLEPQKLKETITQANKLGFITAVGYIFGLPEDTKETIQTTIDYSLNCGSTLANYYTLSILRGSDLEQRYKNKKICNLSNEEVLKLATYASKKFYTKPAILLKISYMIAKNPQWLVKTTPHLLSILARIGFAKIKS